MTSDPVVDALCRPDFYPHHPASVELVQTHASYIFLAGDFVYKIKKPVRYDFLDFTTLEKRKFFCEEEIRLNRRLAPSVYLEVVPLSRNQQGTLVRGEENIVEYAVKMRRLPDDRMLKTLLRANPADLEPIAPIARTVAAFHKEAQTGGRIDEGGSLAAIRKNTEENFDETKKFIDVTIARHAYEFIADFTRAFLSANEPLLASRVSRHHIRDCHGDLHMEHICMTDGVVIFDCIEFNERFRFIDTAAEIAFLMMDLDFHGYARQADLFGRTYMEHSGDTQAARLIDFYRAYYAYVRGKVTSLRLLSNGLPAAARDEITTLASRYFDLAYAYAARLEKPVLMLTAGLIGSGKSYQARSLESLLGARVIRTDVLRKEMLGITPSEKHADDFGKGIYADDITERTYARAFELAEAGLRAGHPVILDASFGDRAKRKAAGRLAEKVGVPFYVLDCVCPDDVVVKRLERRARDLDNPSDGRWEILTEQKKIFHPIDEMDACHYFRIDTSDRPERLRHEIVRTLKMRELSGQ